MNTSNTNFYRHFCLFFYTVIIAYKDFFINKRKLYFMKNKNILRWIILIVIIAIIAVSEWAKHLPYLRVVSDFILHIIATAVIAAIVFIVLFYVFKMLDKEEQKVIQLHEEIEKKNKELDSANKDLEQCVKEKTVDLQKALDKLKEEHDELAKTHDELVAAYQNLQKDERELAKIQTYAAKEEKISQLCGEAGEKLRCTLKNLDSLKTGLGADAPDTIKNLDSINNDVLEILKTLDQIDFWMKAIEPSPLTLREL